MKLKKYLVRIEGTSRLFLYVNTVGKTSGYDDGYFIEK